MFPGIELEIKGQKLIVPALSLKQLREGGMELMQKTDEIAKVSDNGYDTMELRGKLIHMALQRNYPDLKLEDVMESLDLRNTVPTWLAVLGVSGLGDNAPKGEAETAIQRDLTPGISAPSSLN